MSPARAVLAVAMAAMLAPGCKSEPGSRPGRAAPAEAVERAEPVEHGKRVQPAEPAFQRFATAGEALGHILAVTAPVGEGRRARPSRPRVIGVGEFHQTTGTASVRSAIERFTGELDVVARSASDLIVETWVEAGACGETETAVSKDVRQVTERPPAVENHLLRLLSGAKQRGLSTHVLEMTCADYESLSAGGEVDYEKMLELIKRKLVEVTTLVFEHRRTRSDSRTILIYGGALHNDIYPHQGLELMSDAADVSTLAGNDYVEIDLYVPELIAGNALLAQQPWYPVFEREAGPDRVLVFERGPRSYIVILRKGVIGGARP